MLKAGETRIKVGDEWTAFATGPGYFKVQRDRAIVLVDDAVRAEEIDVELARRQADEARVAARAGRRRRGGHRPLARRRAAAPCREQGRGGRPRLTGDRAEAERARVSAAAEQSAILGRGPFRVAAAPTKTSVRTTLKRGVGRGGRPSGGPPEPAGLPARGIAAVLDARADESVRGRGGAAAGGSPAGSCWRWSSSRSWPRARSAAGSGCT